MTAPTGRTPRRGLVALTLVVLAAVACLLSLGTWQVRRLSEKEALILHVRARLQDAPVDLPPPLIWPTMDPVASDYQPVRLTGHFDPAHEFRVFATLAEPRGREGGVGWWVFQPFIETDGTTVIVNRGFIPDRLRDPSTRPGTVPAGDITLTGLLRRPEGSNLFTPANDIGRNQWFTRDPIAMARQIGVATDRILPFYIDAAASETPPGGFPQAGETVIEFPNNHLGYAITWYGLAAAAVVIYAVLVRRRLRPPVPA